MQDKTQFKVGDIVELDKDSSSYHEVSDYEHLEGHLKINRIKVDDDNDVFLYFLDKQTGQSDGFYDWRFKLVESKPTKKPHAWALVEEGKIVDIYSTRAKAREGGKGWTGVYKIKKVFLEFAN